MAYFPESSSVTRDQLMSIRKQLMDRKIPEALTQIKELSLTDKDDKVKMRLDYWYAKALYNIGDYKTALELADEQVTKFFDKYPDLSNEFDSFSSMPKEASVNSFKDE